MKIFKKQIIFFAVVLFVSACGTTEIKKSHPLLADSEAGNIVKVYFIRPDPGFLGVAGNAFTILLSGNELLTIAKGEYTLVNLKPYSGDITVESTTVVNRSGMNTQITVKESLPFKFESGNTYYITFEAYERGMMQGVSYIPRSIAENTARKLAGKLKPIGKAISNPL